MKRKRTLNPVTVHDYVTKAHSDLDGLKELVEDEPMLVNAAIDWGDGDWESGLTAAAHMGRRDIAEYLISKGAQLDLLYIAAMLNELELVKAILNVFPEARHVPGAHGIPLIVHAKHGGANEVVAYLESLETVTE